MSKGTSLKAAPKATAKQFATVEAVNGELTAMRVVANYLRANPQKLKQLAIEMKIHTKSGKLTKVYGG